MILLEEKDGKYALILAKATILNLIDPNDNTKDAQLKLLDPNQIPKSFDEKRGIFVTLTKHGELRGCIGYPYPFLELKEALVDAAISAATRDPRFMPVTKKELPSLEYEVTILTPPEILDCPPHMRPSNIRVGKDGLIVKGYGHSGLLLPQVAEEYGWDEEEFLQHTCIKAGLNKDAWMESDTVLYTFQGQIFSDHD